MRYNSFAVRLMRQITASQKQCLDVIETENTFFFFCCNTLSGYKSFLFYFVVTFCNPCACVIAPPPKKKTHSIPIPKWPFVAQLELHGVLRFLAGDRLGNIITKRRPYTAARAYLNIDSVSGFRSLKAVVMNWMLLHCQHKHTMA